MEAFTDAVRLRALGLGAGVIDVLDRQIQLILVRFRVAAELAAAVSQYAQELDIVLLKNGSTRSLSRSAAVMGVLRS